MSVVKFRVSADDFQERGGIGAVWTAVTYMLKPEYFAGDDGKNIVVFQYITQARRPVCTIPLPPNLKQHIDRMMDEFGVPNPITFELNIPDEFLKEE